MNIYIVKAHGGEYEDHWENNVKAFKTLEKAEECKKELEDNQPEYNEYFSKLIGRIYEFAHTNALKVCEEEYYDEYGRVADILRDKARKKYPRYTEDRDEANSFYRIEEVEMEE